MKAQNNSLGADQKNIVKIQHYMSYLYDLSLTKSNSPVVLHFAHHKRIIHYTILRGPNCRISLECTKTHQ